MTHFTRNAKRTSAAGAAKALVLNGASISPSSKLKLLGVILDQKLKYHDHIRNASKQGGTTVLALKRLKNLRPEKAKQLYNSTVMPVTDYASVIWSPNASQAALKQIEQI